MDNSVMTPKQIVAELDRYIIGQHEAKVAVAIALRNRYRRSKLPAAMRDNSQKHHHEGSDGRRQNGDSAQIGKSRQSALCQS